ncbi:MAG: hypothetical protein ACI4EX_12540 [Lachnospiraceae bacterium]
MKRNIFEIVHSQKNPLVEIKRISKLLNENGGVYVADDILSDLTHGTPVSIIKYIDDELFKSWKQRGTCISCDDFESALGIAYLPQTVDDLTDEYILNFCEYVANMIYLLRIKLLRGDSITNIVDATEENVKSVLSWYNYELKYYREEEKVLAVVKNAPATIVAEKVASQSLSYCIVEYNHHLLKGNIARKKEILLAMGSDLEPRRKELREVHKNLEKNIFTLLNNMDIRHNNCQKGDKNYVEKVARMQKKTLEKWYDKIYQLMLTAYMLLDDKVLLEEADQFASLLKSSGKE